MGQPPVAIACNIILSGVQCVAIFIGKHLIIIRVIIKIKADKSEARYNTLV